jgi:hypothetical protein
MKKKIFVICENKSAFRSHLVHMALFTGKWPPTALKAVWAPRPPPRGHKNNNNNARSANADLLGVLFSDNAIRF